MVRPVTLVEWVNALNLIIIVVTNSLLKNSLILSTQLYLEIDYIQIIVMCNHFLCLTLYLCI